MFISRRKLAEVIGIAAFGLVSAGIGIASSAAPASAAVSTCNPEFNFECHFTAGEQLWVVTANSPLRHCDSDSCSPFLYMPRTKSLKPGGGWVTSLRQQSPTATWCSINYKGRTGWTGCYRLAA